MIGVSVPSAPSIGDKSQISFQPTPPAVGGAPAVLLESSSYLLIEDGSHLLLE